MAAPKENTNAEKWDTEEAIKLFDKAIALTEKEDSKYDFIGEVAKKLKTHRDVFVYLKKKFPKAFSKNG